MAETPSRLVQSDAHASGEGQAPDRPLRVVYLTSGAAGMICGSCLHDNTLARALTRAGVDIQLVPTYTPIRTDEPDASTKQVFFGGLNVYFEQVIPGYSYLPRWLTGWLDRPGLIRWATSFGIQTDGASLGALAVSMLKGVQGNQRREVERLVDWLVSIPRPDVIHLTNLLIGGCLPRLKERLACPVVVTLQGDDIFLDSLPEPHRSRAVAEMRRLAPFVDRFVVNSRYYADLMSGLLGIPQEKLEIEPLTIDTQDFLGPANNAADRAVSSSSGEASGRVIGYLARLAPEKGLHVLVDAFIQLKRRPGQERTRLRVAGWLGEHRKSYLAEQLEKLRAAGCLESFDHVGEVDRRGKVEFLRGLDVMSVPAVYREPKGLYVLESLAAGTPVVVPNHGAFPEMLARVGGGVLVPPEDSLALADALESLLKDDASRRQLGHEGREATLRLAAEEQMVAATLELYRDVISGPGRS
ncbi:MAG: glycosyltransferase family 4 protein [Pirellulales bacterium]